MDEIDLESKAINEEENLLDLDLSSYSSLASMGSTVDVFRLLWNTMFNFHVR